MNKVYSNYVKLPNTDTEAIVEEIVTKVRWALENGVTRIYLDFVKEELDESNVN